MIITAGNNRRPSASFTFLAKRRFISVAELVIKMHCSWAVQLSKIQLHKLSWLLFSAVTLSKEIIRQKRGQTYQKASAYSCIPPRFRI